MRKVTCLGVCLAAVLGAVTYGAKQQVMILEGRLASLERSVSAQKEAAHLLKAEWAHLTSPARLEKLAQNHLNMAPMGGWQVISEPQMSTFLDHAAPHTSDMRYASAQDTPLLEGE
ncbi:MAG: hypothetical protein C0514_05625 [Candidatus Puniceispirillum sp.]|nr:hypothetical protein [Candidatus Puniceispirillum sp.]